MHVLCILRITRQIVGTSKKIASGAFADSRSRPAFRRPPPHAASARFVAASGRRCRSMRSRVVWNPSVVACAFRHDPLGTELAWAKTSGPFAEMCSLNRTRRDGVRVTRASPCVFRSAGHAGRCRRQRCRTTRDQGKRVPALHGWLGINFRGWQIDRRKLVHYTAEEILRVAQQGNVLILLRDLPQVKSSHQRASVERGGAS